MPSPSVFWSTWHVDPLAAALLVLAVGCVLWWSVASVRRGAPLRPWRLASLLVALTLFGVLQFGIVGAYDTTLRWAFTLRTVLLFTAVPTFLALGAPATLLRSGGPTRLADAADAVLRSRPVRVLGTPIVSPLVALAVFSVLLTPLSAVIRQSPAWAAGITLGAPAVGFLLLAPLGMAGAVAASSAAATAEFLLAFVELVLDAIPGIVLRITGHVLDRVTIVPHGPAWFPTALGDQHLAGDLLWFIAEVADIPVLIALFVRWQRSDRREAKAVDELSDEEMAELTRAHLRRHG